MVLKDRTFVPERETGTDLVVSPVSLGTGLPSRTHTWELGQLARFRSIPTFLVGTSGEFYGLSLEERWAAFEICIDEARGRVPIYAGVNGITTAEAIKYAQMAEECKADAISVLTPMFVSLTQGAVPALCRYRPFNQASHTPVQQCHKDQCEHWG